VRSQKKLFYWDITFEIRMLTLYFKPLKYFFRQKNGKLRCSIIFMSMQFYSILISLFWQLTGRAHWAWKGVRVVGGSTISDKWGNHLPCQPTIAAQLLGNGGKIEPYTIIIMTCDSKKWTVFGQWHTVR
jgi:hypothetical protein